MAALSVNGLKWLDFDMGFNLKEHRFPTMVVSLIFCNLGYSLKIPRGGLDFREIIVCIKCAPYKNFWIYTFFVGLKSNANHNILLFGDVNFVMFIFYSSFSLQTFLLFTTHFHTA